MYLTYCIVPRFNTWVTYHFINFYNSSLLIDIMCIICAYLGIPIPTMCVPFGVKQNIPT